MDGFEKEDIVGQKDLDPFNGSFYKTFNPIIASFRINDGKCDGHYGKLERIQEIAEQAIIILIMYSHMKEKLSCMEMVTQENCM